jgi:hypothetical protein
MNHIEHILARYQALRADGLDLKAALANLDSEIESLGSSGKLELSRKLRALESGKKPLPNRPAKSAAPDPEATIEYPAVNVAKVNCPHCGKANPQGEMLCYACGPLLVKKSPSPSFKTQMLHKTAQLVPDEDYFGMDTTLVLTARHTRKDYEIRPQDRDGEFILGRRTHRSPLNPDVDLGDSDGNRLGVSRLHMSIRYDKEYNSLTVFDLGSANGSYVNGQRLHPHEVRVLRNNDELRLGHMMLLVRFKHSTSSSL